MGDSVEGVKHGRNISRASFTLVSRRILFQNKIAALCYISDFSSEVNSLVGIGCWWGFFLIVHRVSDKFPLRINFF